VIVLYIQHKTGFDSKFRNRLADSEGNISRWRAEETLCPVGSSSRKALLYRPL